MKLLVKKGAVSQTVYLFVLDSSVTTGAGKTGLAFNTASLTAYYVRPLGSATAITLATQTVAGAWAAGGFVEVDAANMPGVYRLDLPDAVCAAGANSVAVMLKGAANMAPVVLEIQLVGYDPNDAGGLGLGYLTGDAFARIGAAGAGLTALGDARLANLDAPVSTRLPTASYAAPLSAAGTAAAVWDAATATYGAAGSYGALVEANLDAAVGTRSTLTAAGVRTELATELARIDVATSTRLSAAGYTAPDNATVTWLRNYLEGDREIDNTVTPWAEVVKQKATATELARKKLRQVGGGNVTSTDHVIGSAREV